MRSDRGGGEAGRAADLPAADPSEGNTQPDVATRFGGPVVGWQLTDWRIPPGWTVGERTKPTTCKSKDCGKPILFATNDRTGKASPFDPAPDDIDLFSVNHFATCPAAPTFRGPRRPKSE